MERIDFLDKIYKCKGLSYVVDEYGNIIGKNGTIKQRKTKDGYRCVTMGKIEYGRSLQLVHRIVASLFVEKECDEKIEVNHIDGNKENNYYKNLEWVTRKENMEHAVRCNLFNNRQGTNNSNAKLSIEDVVNIRNSYDAGLSSVKLSKIYNVTKESIMNIVNFKTWKHIK